MCVMENKVKFAYICTDRLTELLFLPMILVPEYFSSQNQIFLMAEYIMNLNETKATCC